jgi:predicted outer membrane repeat protein
VQDGLDAAGPGNEIWVAEGVYTPTDGVTRTATFQLKDGVALYGGFGGYGISETVRTQRDWETHVTVLSGDLDGNDTTDAHGVVTGTANIVGDNAYHVVTGSGVTTTATLDGFTVTAGKADGGDPYDRGGGMVNDGGSPQLANVTFSGNTANEGGGMYNLYSSSALANVSFSGNSAGSDGGGMVNYSGSPTLANVTFSGNSAGSDGGGMVNYSGSPTLANVTFSGNSATSNGGGIFSQNSSPTLANCILWGNNDSGGTDQSAQIHIDDASPITITYSLVQGGVYTGTGNISANPQFARDPDPGDGDWTTLADNDYGDLSLLPSSPAIDAGDNAALPADVTDLDDDGNMTEPIPLDLAGEWRIASNRVDMGAYEWHPIFYLPLVLRS